MHKKELDVVEENRIALHLYKKFGFQIEEVSKMRSTIVTENIIILFAWD